MLLLTEMHNGGMSCSFSNLEIFSIRIFCEKDEVRSLKKDNILRSQWNLQSHLYLWI